VESSENLVPVTRVSVFRVEIATGMRGVATLVVTGTDTARALGSGNVDVLGTPRLIALCEEATVNAVAAALPEGSTTVGVRVELDHVRPTAVGGEVSAEAELQKVDGRQLTFVVSASDPGGVVGTGRITRALIDVERFMAKLH
jgi:fluoroacetyl-CoA thioesterase